MRRNQTVLMICNFCGKSNVLSHNSYPDRCVDCGKRYIKYSSYKSLQRSAPSAKRAVKLQEVAKEYLLLESRGCKVPRDLHDIDHLADAVLYNNDDSLNHPIAATQNDDVCPFCGAESPHWHPKYLDRCLDCGKRYAKYSNYKSLQKSSPTVKRQALLEDIVAEYKMLERQGYKVPRDIKEMR